MSIFCNAQVESPTGEAHGVDIEAGDWGSLYRQNEKAIESGSAYFSQAFAEALGLVSDVELHDLEQARLRLGAIASLLGHAIREYDISLDIDTRTGLGDFHEGQLRKSGLNSEGTVRVFGRAREQGYIVASDDFIARISRMFSEHGYRALMDQYLHKVRNIHDLVSSAAPAANKDGGSAKMWQGFVWQLTSAFADTMWLGQSIAIMNAAAYR